MMVADFIQALRVQARVVHASILREMRTRFGRSKLGYLWALFEPMAYLLTLVGMFSALGRGSPIAGVDISMFFFTAIIPWLIFAKTVGSVGNAISANQRLLTYPQVKPIDVVLARAILEFATLFLVAVIYLLGAGYLGFFVGIENILQAILALFSALLLGLGVGLLGSSIKVYFPAYSNVQSAFMRVMFFTSGKFFVAESLPPLLQEWLWYNPMLHVTEWTRSAFFSEFDSNFYDLRYPLGCVLVLLFLGLASERVSRQKLRQV